jgi:CPA2 family monovalent cation:H+ antiporter-2
VSFLAYRFSFALALGAFLVGVVGGASDERGRISALVGPLRSMFAAMFFISIGLLVDPAGLWANAPAILVVSAVVVVGKLLNNVFASLLAGVDMRTSVQVGFSLAQIGEFAFMVAILYAQLVDDPSNPMFSIAVGASLLTTLLNPLMIRMSDRAGDFAERAMPSRFRSVHEAYRAWLAKIGAAEGSPAFRKLRTEAVRLGIYAVLMVAVAMTCTSLCRFDYSGISKFIERHDRVFFFVLANLLCLPLLPLGVSAAKSLADAVAEVLCGEGTSRWQVSVQHVVRHVVRFAVFALFFVEWFMIVVSIAPREGPTLWIGLGVVALVGIIGWRRLVKAGPRETQRFHDALTAEERRESLARTMELAAPEGVEIQLPALSPAIGGTAVTLNIPAKTGASVVSVFRGGGVARNVGPEWEFRGGDIIVALGNHAQIAALKDLLGVTS